MTPEGLEGKEELSSCKICKKESNIISGALSLCVDCIRENFSKSLSLIREAHRKSRERFGLPASPPSDKGGKSCVLCINNCHIGEGKEGFCGLRRNVNGKLTGVSAYEGKLSFYYDSLPTNCVADWVCAGGTGAGYPRYAYKKGPEYGYKNLAVFYHGCSFNCLFCQNWHFRLSIRDSKKVSAEELANAVDDRTFCICYFGGDPSCQLPHSIKTSRLALKKKRRRILRICWETNGSMNSRLLDEMAELSLESGGCIKFDLKTFDEKLSLALYGISNERTLSNFEKLAKYTRERKEPPFMVASTLLVPGYVDEQEVSQIARFIANLDPEIPYSLLAFYPHFFMRDLPTTSRKHAESCLETAKNAGLRNVHLGNVHLLGRENY